MLGWILFLAGGLCPIAILWYLSDYAVDPHKWIWWGRRLTREVYTPEGQRRLVRWRPLIIVLIALQFVGLIMLISAS